MNKNRKILVVSFGSGLEYSGGQQCSLRNFQSVKSLFGEDNTINYFIESYCNKRSFKTIVKRLKDIFLGYMVGIDGNHIKTIKGIINKENITDIFVDSSLMGSLVKSVRKDFPNINIVTFFHNYEYGFLSDAIRVNHDYLRFYWLILASYNEKNSIKYSNKIICLNERDNLQIQRHYGRFSDMLIPITLKSASNQFDKNAISQNREALFIGSYFYANIEGIKWFCNNVVPYVDINLTIVGSGMDKLSKDIQVSSKINIYSSVPNLQPYFDNADFVVLPIFSGSGMKVKTAESLMHGKFIIGTDEAFRGYQITCDVGRICNTAEEFITEINSLQLKKKFNESSRTLYENRYSFESSLKDFKNLFEL